PALSQPKTLPDSFKDHSFRRLVGRLKTDSGRLGRIRDEAGREEAVVESPFEAVFEAIKAAEARVEGPRPRPEGVAEDSVVEARHHPTVEARMDTGRNTASAAVGVNLVGSPEQHHKR